MPKRVVDFFDCWKGLSGNPQSAGMWKMYCLIFCGVIGGKRNDSSFEDRERTMMDLKSFFNTLFFWAVALDFTNMPTFHDFIDFFFFFFFFILKKFIDYL
jgi:hypothetical protein